VSRRNEVPVSGLHLLERGFPVSEEAPLVGAHLKQAEVLTVPGTGRKTGFAARDRERFTAIRAEDLADHLGRRRVLQRRELSELAALAKGRLGRGNLCLGAGETRPVDPQLALRLGLEAGVGEHPAVLVEESEHLLVLLQRAQVLVQPCTEVGAGPGLSCSREGKQDQGARTYDDDSQGLTSISGTGARLHLTPGSRSCLSLGPP